jgi:hypothetical protein
MFSFPSELSTGKIQPRPIELDPKYADVTIRRFQDDAAKIAALDGNGRSSQSSARKGEAPSTGASTPPLLIRGSPP